MDKITLEFAEKIRSKLNRRLKKIILFGSRARGDYKLSSDYDFLIVVDKRDKNIKEKILNISADISSRNDELIACLIWESEEWLDKMRYPIGINIIKDGREL